jgi:hypothetical protein
MRWEYDRKWWIDKELKGGGHDLFDGTISSLTSRVWGKPRKTSGRVPSNLDVAAKLARSVWLLKVKANLSLCPSPILWISVWGGWNWSSARAWTSRHVQILASCRTEEYEKTFLDFDWLELAVGEVLPGKRFGFWHGGNRSSDQEISRLLRNPKVHYRVHNSPPVVLSRAWRIQSKSSHCILRSILILSFYLHPGISSDISIRGAESPFLRS